MQIRVRCFAAVRELLGAEEVMVECEDGLTLQQLCAKIAADAPGLQQIPLAFAVNQDYASPDRVLLDGDEVAFIPPISGGNDALDPPPPIELYRFDLQHERLDARVLEEQVRTDRDGAVVTFAGVTRNHNEGKDVLGLTYECYDVMARKVMGQLFEEAVRSFQITRARVVHRLGEVPIGEASVLVVVAAEHRGPAFDAARFLMDRLKAEVPIFKKERLSGDQEDRWIGDLPRRGS